MPPLIDRRPRQLGLAALGRWCACVNVLSREDQRDIPSKDLISDPPENVLSARIPASDCALQISRHDRVVCRAIDNCAK